MGQTRISNTTESETIFRTEGSGEDLVKETVMAGRRVQQPIRRVVISKRKQTAVERRQGRDLLRANGFLTTDGDGACIFNTANPCGRCIDCMVYGFAVGTGGAQKSRVLTDDAFSIAPSSQITDRRQFNALFDNSTMRSPVDGKPSTSIGTEEYVRPETHFLDMETLKDVTPAELEYVVGNILRSTRYGAISSRLGRVKNDLVAIVLSDCELFSNLELTQTVYDLLLAKMPASTQQAGAEARDWAQGAITMSDTDFHTFLAGNPELPFPLPAADVRTAVDAAVDVLLPNIPTAAIVIRGEQLANAIREVRGAYASPEAVRAFLGRVADAHARS